MRNLLIRILGGISHENWSNACKITNGQLAKQREEISVLNADVYAAQQKVKRALPLVQVNVSDPQPSDEKKFEAHAREWARFHEDFLAPKLNHLIALAREELDWSGMPSAGHETGLPEGMERRDYDWLMRGTSNAFKMLLDYGLEMKSAYKGIAENNK